MKKKIRVIAPENMNNAVIYTRFSPGHDQSDNSTGFQIKACLAYAERFGFTVIEVYSDESRSGRTDERESFQRMIADSEKGLFSRIIVYRFDRFSRDRYDSVFYKKKLKDNGVCVLSTEESAGGVNESAMIESLYEAMAQDYSDRLSRITSAGMRQAASKGLWMGGNVPFGYKVVEQRLAVDEKKADAVSFIFAKYAEGKTKTWIANALNERGYLTKGGQPFNCTNLSYIMSNKVYYGDYSMGDVERRVPPIITKELFDKVQELLVKNKRCFGRRVSDAFFELGGKVFCGYCGVSMVGDCGTSGNATRHHYYSCRTKRKKGACHKKNEKKEVLERFVCEKTLYYVLKEENIKRIARGLAAKSEASRKSDATLKALERKKDSLEKELDAVTDSLIKTVVKSVIHRLNGKAEQLELQLEAVKADITKQKLMQAKVLKVEDAERYLRSLANGNLDDEDFRRRLIHNFIRRVYVYEDKVKIVYYFGGGDEPDYEHMVGDAESPTQNTSCSYEMGQGEPNTRNPKLLPIGDSFGFLFVFGDLQ